MVGLSTPLQAKKAARDAKRKQLEKLFDQHQQTETTVVAQEEVPAFAIPSITSGEDSSEKSRPAAPMVYASYQNAAPDLESGVGDKVDSGHVVLINEGGGSEQDRGRLLREQAQSLIHMVDDRVPQRTSTVADSNSILEKIQSNPKSFGTMFMMILLYWWL